MTLLEFMEKDLKEMQAKWEQEAKEQGFDNIYQYLAAQPDYEEDDEEEY
jgi:hypothetical protein